MDGYKDAHTHIHPSATATKAFTNIMGFPGHWDGTIDRRMAWLVAGLALAPLAGELLSGSDSIDGAKLKLPTR